MLIDDPILQFLEKNKTKDFSRKDKENRPPNPVRKSTSVVIPKSMERTITSEFRRSNKSHSTLQPANTGKSKSMTLATIPEKVVPAKFGTTSGQLKKVQTTTIKSVKTTEFGQLSSIKVDPSKKIVPSASADNKKRLESDKPKSDRSKTSNAKPGPALSMPILTDTIESPKKGSWTVSKTDEERKLQPTPEVPQQLPLSLPDPREEFENDLQDLDDFIREDLSEEIVLSNNINPVDTASYSKIRNFLLEDPSRAHLPETRESTKRPPGNDFVANPSKRMRGPDLPNMMPEATNYASASQNFQASNIQFQDHMAPHPSVQDQFPQNTLLGAVYEPISPAKGGNIQAPIRPMHQTLYNKFQLSMTNPMWTGNLRAEHFQYYWQYQNYPLCMSHTQNQHQNQFHWQYEHQNSYQQGPSQHYHHAGHPLNTFNAYA